MYEHEANPYPSQKPSPQPSLSNLLNQVRGRLPFELVNAGQFQRLQQAAEWLPDSFLVGLECRLDTASSTTDIWICPALDEAGLQQAGHWLETTGWPEFAALSASLKQGQIPWPLEQAAWTIEFDLDSPKALPLPSSFVTFNSLNNQLEAVETIRQLWVGSRPNPPSEQDLRQLRHLVEQIPQGTLAGWGFLYPRSQSPARLMLAVNDLQQLQPLLLDKYPLAEQLLGNYADKVVIGTPLYYQEEKRQSLEAYVNSLEGWQELIFHLVEHQLIAETKAQALMQLASDNTLADGCWCCLNHLKLAISDSGQAQVKAYPAFGRANFGQ